MKIKKIEFNKGLLLCVVYIFFIPVMSLASSQNSIHVHTKPITQIISMVRQGDLENAKVSLLKKLELDSTNAALHYWLGKVYSESGAYSDSLSHLEKANLLAPENQEISLEYASQLSQQNKFQKAKELYKKILKQTEFRSEKTRITHLLKLVEGREYIHNGEINLALKHYQAMALMYPEDEHVLETLGNIYANLEFWEEAENYYQKTLEVNPNRQSTHLFMAKLYRKNGDSKSKWDHLTKVILLDSHSTNAEIAVNILLEDGKILESSHDMDLAIEEFNVILAVLPGNLDAQMAIASAYEKDGLFSKAESLYQKLENKYPNNIEIKIFLARLYTAFEKPDLAISKYQEIIKTAPDSPWTKETSVKLSRLYAHKSELLGANLDSKSKLHQAIDVISVWINDGRFESAQWLLDRVIRYHPKDAKAKYLQGLIFEQKGQLENALETLSQSIWLDPSLVAARTAQARLLSRLGNLKDAEAAYRDVLSSNNLLDNRKQIEKSLGFTIGEKFVRDGNLQFALAHYREMSGKYATDTEILQRIADIYVLTGDRKQAKLTLKEIKKIKVLASKGKKYFDTGKRLAQIGKYSEAEKQLDLALKIDSQNSELLYWMGYIAAQQLEFDTSSEFYKKSVELDPGNVLTREEFAHSLLKSGQIQLAKQQYKKCFNMVNTPALQKKFKRYLKYVEGQVLIDKGDLKTALTHYQTMSIMFAEDINTLEALASVMVKLDLLLEAKEIHERILRYSPSHTVSNIRLANIAGLLDDQQARRTYFEKAIQMDGQGVGEIAEKILLQKAKQYIALKDYQSAQNELDTILSVKPKHIKANQVLADLYIEKGQYEDAKNVFTRLLALRPIDLETRVQLAELYVNTNQMDYALLEYKKIFDIAPSTEIGQNANAKLDFLYGLEAERISKDLLTERDQENAIEISKQWIQISRLDAALWLLTSVIENNPENIQAFYWLSILHERRGEFEIALAYIDNVLKMDNSNQSHLLVAANLNYRLGNLDAAEQQYLEVISTSQADVGRYNKAKRKYNFLIGSRLVSSGKLKTALSHYRKMQTKHLNDTEIMARIGSVLNKLGHHKSERKVYLNALRIDPGNKHINLALASLYKQLGKHKAYLKQLRQVFLVDPTGGLDESSLVQLRLEKGIKQLHRHRWEDAIVAFNRALEVNPNNLYAQVGISAAYKQGGELNKSNSSMNKIMQLKDSHLNDRLSYLNTNINYVFEE